MRLLLVKACISNPRKRASGGSLCNTWDPKTAFGGPLFLALKSMSLKRGYENRAFTDHPPNKNLLFFYEVAEKFKI